MNYLTEDQWVRVFLSISSAFLGVIALHGIVTGRMSTKTGVVKRQEDAFFYWFLLIMCVVPSVMLFYMALKWNSAQW